MYLRGLAEVPPGLRAESSHFARDGRFLTVKWRNFADESGREEVGRSPGYRLRLVSRGGREGLKIRLAQAEKERRKKGERGWEVAARRGSGGERSDARARGAYLLPTSIH